MRARASKANRAVNMKSNTSMPCSSRLTIACSQALFSFFSAFLFHTFTRSSTLEMEGRGRESDRENERGQDGKVDGERALLLRFRTFIRSKTLPASPSSSSAFFTSSCSLPRHWAPTETTGVRQQGLPLEFFAGAEDFLDDAPSLLCRKDVLVTESACKSTRMRCEIRCYYQGLLSF